MFAFNLGFNSFNTMPNLFMGGGCHRHHHHHCNPYNNYSGFRFAMAMPLFMNMLSGQRNTNPFIQELMQPNFYQQIPVPNYYSMPNYNNIFSNIGMNYNSTPVSTYANVFDTNYNSFLNNLLSNNTALLNLTSPVSVNNTSKASSTDNVSSSQPIVDSGKVDKNFLNKVKQVAQNLNCDYKDLLAVINSESGFNPRAGAGTNYVGLIQFGEYAIQDLRNKAGCTGLTKEKILNMSPIEQMDLVEKMIKIGKKYGGFADNARLSGGDLYAIIFAPCRSGNEVLYRKGEAGYNSVNAKMDYNNDGKITKTEMSERIRRKYVNESIFA